MMMGIGMPIIHARTPFMSFPSRIGLVFLERFHTSPVPARGREALGQVFRLDRRGRCRSATPRSFVKQFRTDPLGEASGFEVQWVRPVLSRPGSGPEGWNWSDEDGSRDERADEEGNRTSGQERSAAGGATGLEIQRLGGDLTRIGRRRLRPRRLSARRGRLGALSRARKSAGKGGISPGGCSSWAPAGGQPNAALW